MKQNKGNKGFTLIELLVVIAIIGLLAALLQPAIFGALKKAKITRAQAETKSIENAIRAYFNEYSKLPVPDDDQGGEDATYTASGNSKNRGSPVTTSLIIIDRLGTNNPRHIIFLEVPTATPAGTFKDMWGTQYAIALDTDYNSELVIGTNKVLAPGYAYSAGPDANFATETDNIYSYK